MIRASILYFSLHYLCSRYLPNAHCQYNREYHECILETFANLKVDSFTLEALVFRLREVCFSDEMLSQHVSIHFLN